MALRPSLNLGSAPLAGASGNTVSGDFLKLRQTNESFCVVGIVAVRFQRRFRGTTRSALTVMIPLSSPASGEK